MTSRTTTLTSKALMNMPENEKLAAQHMKWWPVYLIREKRRLQGIADRVQADEEARASASSDEAAAPIKPALEQEFVLESDGISRNDDAQAALHPSVALPVDAATLDPEELLLMLDTDFATQQALEALEETDEPISDQMVDEASIGDDEETSASEEDTQPMCSFALVGEPGGALNDNDHPTSYSSKARSRSRIAGKAHLLGSKQEDEGDTY